MSKGKERYYTLLLMLLGGLLSGYGLVAPFRLNRYFVAKPAVDLLTDSALILILTFGFFRLVRRAYPAGLFFIPLLALFWLRLDFLLYSKSEWFAIVSYLMFGFWAFTFSQWWKQLNLAKTGLINRFSAVLTLFVGMLWGFSELPDTTLLFVSIGFSLCLTMWFVDSHLKRKRLWSTLASLLIFVTIWQDRILEQPVFFESQKRHHDKVVYSFETRFQRLDVTEWKGNYWFYQDDINHFSSIDAWLYYEPFVHPAMQLVKPQPRVLIIGGENGMLADYLKQYEPASLDLLPVDAEYLEVASTKGFYTSQNNDVYGNTSMNIIASPAFRWLSNATNAYDVIFVDVPDPIDIELNQYYTREFYELAFAALNESGVLVTQSGSPYFATAAFQSIEKTMKAADFEAISFHNQVLSLGEWGWTLGAKTTINLDSALRSQTFAQVNTQWLNQEAMHMMLSFGKPYVTVNEVEVNTIKNPVIHRLYRQGNYQLN